MRTLGSDNPLASYRALHAWTRRAHASGLAAWCIATNDAELLQEIAALERVHLVVGQAREAQPWVDRRADLDLVAVPDVIDHLDAWPIEVVVGLPRSLKGGEGPAAVKVRGFAQDLARSIAPVAVRLLDERMTTVTAGQGLRASGVKSKKGRSVIDQAAAVIILQQALESERVSGNPPGEGVEVVI